MADFKERIDELARLMDEFQLAEARLESEEFTVSFRRRAAVRTVEPSQSAAEQEELFLQPVGRAQAAAEPEPAAKGVPIPSPMAGIFYASPNPSSPAFVKEGDEVTPGQIVGLIEAMKVFNEIPCSLGGVVLKVVAQGGEIVQLGDPLIIIEPWQ